LTAQDLEGDCTNFKVHVAEFNIPLWVR